MSAFLLALLYLAARYLHIVCATFLVGGTLFYEMVVPMAIDDLRPEQQMVVFARARLVFTWIVWISCGLMIASGIVSTQLHWDSYNPPQVDNSWTMRPPHMPGYWQGGFGGNRPPWATSRPTSRPQRPLHTLQQAPVEITFAGRSGLWWAAHASTGLMSTIIAFGLTLGKAPPPHSVRWMRINLAILLLVMFLATATRQARLAEQQHHMTTMEQLDSRG